MTRPKLIAFDFFGTLVANEVSEWIATFEAIAEEQSLAIAGPDLHAEWSRREQNFRLVRTNMADPPSSPPFRTYWQAWRDAFAETFADLRLPGDAAAAATRCVDDHCSRKAFDDANDALIQLVEKAPLAIMSNADNVFLHGSIAFNGWAFDPVISSEGARAYKPDPRAFAALCAATGVNARDALYVGDSPYDDAHGAKLAGMQTVLVNRKQHTLGRTPPPDAVTLLAPDHEIQSLIELPALLDALAKVRTTP